MNASKYHTSISENYVRDWTFEKAISELLQNAIDAGEYGYGISKGSLTISSPSQELPKNSLLLGETTKYNDSASIGNFGEGYKLAMLVLCRLGYNCYVQNPRLKEMWEFSLEEHPSFGTNVLTVSVIPMATDAPFEINDELRFWVDGEIENPDVFNQLLFSIAKADPSDVEYTDTAYIIYKLKERGNIYVNGLFVAKDNQLQYGYSFHSDCLQLDRDRKTVNQFNLELALASVWADSNNYDAIVEMVMDNAKDVCDLQYKHNLSSELLDKLYDLFKLKYGNNAIAVRSQEEADARQKSDPNVKPVVVHSGLVGTLAKHSGYIASVPREIHKPTATLMQWYENNKRHMRRNAKLSFKELILKSEKWRE